MRNFLIAEEFQNAEPNATYGTTTNTKIAVQVLNKTSGLIENVFVNGMGAVAGQFMNAGGPNAMVRFAQGKGALTEPDVVTPWVRAGNMLSYDGLAYSAPQASHTELDINGTSTAGTDGVLSLKFILDNPQDGVDQFWHLDVDIPGNTADTAQDALVATAYNNATKPEWLFKRATISAGMSAGTDYPAAANGGAVSSATDVVRFHGNIPGSVDTSSGKEWAGDSSNISVVVLSQEGIGNTAYSEINKVIGSNGIGSYYEVNKYEEKMMGKNYGYYNRRELPNTPASTANSSSTYNYVNMVFSKDGSTNGTIGGIKGVDNLIEIIIAGKVGGTELWAPPVGLANSSFEDVINYLAGTPQAAGNTFPFINLA